MGDLWDLIADLANEEAHMNVEKERKDNYLQLSAKILLVSDDFTVFDKKHDPGLIRTSGPRFSLPAAFMYSPLRPRKPSCTIIARNIVTMACLNSLVSRNWTFVNSVLPRRVAVLS